MIQFTNSTGLNVPDYVFEDNYNLVSLEDYFKYIEINKHLPGLPEASDKKRWAQIDLQARDMKLLEKLEEVVLYIKQLNDRIKVLESENRFLKSNQTQIQQK